MAEPETMIAETTWRGKNPTTRRQVLTVGGEYVIAPLNPQKKKNRGRRCVILAFVDLPDGWGRVAKVRYLDNNRQGRAELDDLIAAGPETCNGCGQRFDRSELRQDARALWFCGDCLTFGIWPTDQERRP